MVDSGRDEPPVAHAASHNAPRRRPSRAESPGQPLVRRGRSYHGGKSGALQTMLSRMSLPRKSTMGGDGFKDCAEFLWEAFDEMGPEEWVLPSSVNPRKIIPDILVNRYKDRNVDGTVIFAAAEYCAHIIDNGGEPDTWRRTPRRAEDVPHIMRAVLDAKADPNAQASHTKGAMRAMHYAAGLGVVPVLEVLLEAAVEAAGPQGTREAIQAKALNVRTRTDNNQEHYAPLHDSVWFKKHKATEWLLLNGADPNAQNAFGWTPMHIVAMQGKYIEFVELLMKFGADLRRQDKNGDNPLMTAVNKPLFPVSKFHLLASSCHDPKSSFLAYLRDIYTLALENEQAAEEFVEVLLGRHRLGELPTNDQQDTDSESAVEERPLRFMLSVDSATARSGQESEKALAMMAEVMEKAPRAAAMILSVLVGAPMVECPEHHPLPLRANMLLDGCEETMICDYQPDYFEEEDDSGQELSWMTRVSLSRAHVPVERKRRKKKSRSGEPGAETPGSDGEKQKDTWETLRKNLLPKVHVVRNFEEEVSRRCRLPCWGFDAMTNTAPPWHTSLAPMTEKRNDDKEVIVEVLKMPDLLDVRVIRVLANTEHLSLFAEKTVQGIVNCLWHHLVKHGVRVGICLDVLTLATLLAWIIFTEMEDVDRVPLRRTFWVITASTGLKELFNVAYSLYLCYMLGRRLTSYLASADVTADLVATCALVALAHSTRDDFAVPRVGWGRSILALNVLMRWFQITYMCRPFSKVGKKIVCVLKSFMPMKEMMFITAVVFFGFAVAALLIKDNASMQCEDHCSATVLMNLFKALLMGDGDGFDDLTTLPGGDPSGIFAGALILLATIIFSVSVLNLLIAVYSNEYDRKEKQSDLLFFQERAGICFRYLMEPLWSCWREKPAWLWRRWEIWFGQSIRRPPERLAAAERFVKRLVGGVFCLLFALAIFLAEETHATVSPVVLVVAAMLLAQVASKRCEWEQPVRSQGGTHFYLWMCSQSSLGKQDPVVDDGSRSNQDVHSALRQLSRSLEKQMGELKGEIKAVNARVADVSRQLVRTVPDSASPKSWTPGLQVPPWQSARQSVARCPSAPSKSPMPPSPTATPPTLALRLPRALPAAAEGLRKLQHEVSMRQQQRAEELASACLSPRPAAPASPQELSVATALPSFQPVADGVSPSLGSVGRGTASLPLPVRGAASVPSPAGAPSVPASPG